MRDFLQAVRNDPIVLAPVLLALGFCVFAFIGVVAVWQDTGRPDTELMIENARLRGQLDMARELGALPVPEGGAR